MRTARGASKILFFIVWTALLAPLQALVLLLHKGKGSYAIPALYHKGICAAFGIRIEVSGIPNAGHQTLFMSNHLSYMDICALGSLLPVSFLAKQDVESWPLFGLLSRLQQTVYIERRRMAIAQAKSDLENFLAGGRSLIVFPEGTSTSGMNVKPFKTSLFSLAEGRPDLWFQPVTIALLEADGRRPRTQDDFNIYAWPLEMDTSLHAHLWAFAKTSGARLQITFHPPLPAAGADRKALAKACHESVSMGLERALAA